VKTGGMPINQAVMALPYKDPSSALMTLVENMAQTGMRVGGTSEMQVGEGRADAPVGTTLAMIDQATKVLNSVHKRMHSAQADEFKLLVRTFRENPESFWNRLKRPTTEWNEQTFLGALNDCELVPQADPNTASQTQRMMKIMGLKQLQQANPSMYDPIAIDTAALKAMGWSNPEQFLAPKDAQAAPPPELQQIQAKIQTDQQKAQAALMSAQIKGQEVQQRGQIDMMKAQADAMRAQADIHFAQQEIHEKKKDRLSRERVQMIDLAQNLAVHPESVGVVEPLLVPAMEDMEREQREQQMQQGGIMPPGMGGQ